MASALTFVVVFLTAISWAERFAVCPLLAQSAPVENNAADMIVEDVEYEPAPRKAAPSLSFYSQSLGHYAYSIPAMGVVALVLTSFVVIRGGSDAPSAAAFIVASPMLLALYCTVSALNLGFQRLGEADEPPFPPNELARGITTIHFRLLLGFFATAPSFIVATAGLFIRAMMGEKQSGKSST